MSRSGYSDDWDGDGTPPEFYRKVVENSIRGKRGQTFLRRLAVHMDAMPEKKLVAHDWVTQDGAACTLGVALQAEAPDLAEKSKGWYPDDDGRNCDAVAKALDISSSMAAELVWLNDEGAYRYWGGHTETPEARWARVRRWVQDHIKPEPAGHG